MKMEIMQHAYCNCEGGCDLRLEGKKSLFFPQFVASLVFFSFLDGKVQCKCYSAVVYYPEQSPKDFLLHLVGSEPGNSHEGFTERQVVGCPSVYLPLKVNRGNIHCPRGPLCYQQHKDSHPCSPVNPTCISNDFQKKSKRESTVVLSFPWRQIEKAFSLKSVAWFTVFSPLSICALPFSLLLFPSHCFSSPAFCFSDLPLAPFSSHSLIQYEVWTFNIHFHQRKHATSTLECLWSCVNKCVEKA